MKIIYVDIDGTLTNEIEGHSYARRTPNKFIIGRINELFNNGNTIVLWTSRYACDRDITFIWLHRHNVKFHMVIFDKPKFDLYVCDRVLNVKDVV